MTISETQLATWSNQGATTSAGALYQRIKAAIDNAPEFAGKDVRVYLQGSYRNSTNTRGDSDVDVVAELADVFISNASELPPDQYRLHQAQHATPAYQLWNFRQDLVSVVRRAFPLLAITEGTKSIKIPRSQSNIPADVVPCCTYREYQSYFGEASALTHVQEGIWIFDSRRMQGVIGFPKQHYSNGVAKNADTGTWFKPSVRLFKNIRTALAEQHLIRAELASSNHIECLIYNVPDECFGESFQGTFVEAVNWMIQADLTDCVCVHGQRRLFRTDGWKVEQAKELAGRMANLWEEWGRNARLRF